MIDGFYYGILPNKGSFKDCRNPLCNGRVELANGNNTVFELMGNGLVTQITFKGPMNKKSCPFFVQVDNGDIELIHNAGCISKMGLIGLKGIGTNVYLVEWGDSSFILSCHIPFRFHKNFKFGIKIMGGGTIFTDFHLYYLVREIKTEIHVDEWSISK